MEAFETYQTPLSRCDSSLSSEVPLSDILSFFVFEMSSRYASKEMAHLFSPAVCPYLSHKISSSLGSSILYTEPVLYLEKAVVESRDCGEAARVAYL